jgi:hypothetical protein
MHAQVLAISSKHSAAVVTAAMAAAAAAATSAGSWQHNKYQGHGKYTFPDGKHYQVGHSPLARTMSDHLALPLLGLGLLLLLRGFILAQPAQMLVYQPCSNSRLGETTGGCIKGPLSNIMGVCLQPSMHQKTLASQVDGTRQYLYL